jgi:PAS domain S-box-containing protein
VPKSGNGLAGAMRLTRNDRIAGLHSPKPLLKAGALEDAILKGASFSSIATDDRGVIQVFNLGAERMLGYAAADVINKLTPADISDRHEIAARAEALSLEFSTPIAPDFEAMAFRASRGAEDVYEVTQIRKDGSRLAVAISVSALRDAQDAIIGYLLVGTDNTARKKAEAEQAQLDQALQETNLQLKSAKLAAETANLAKSEFLSSMSHELRSPLNAILGFAQLIESGSPPPTPGQKDSIEQILQAGWYLLDLINEVLDLALVESGKLSLSPEPMSVAEVLGDCQAMIEPFARKAGIRVTYPKLDGPYFIKADRTRVKQVLINLLSNAIKYNREGGTVDVRFDTTRPRRLRISFHDTGEGLSADDLKQLFQSFNRLGQGSGATQGTGIGLVVSKRLVELMGGTIGVESVVGVGSVFWVEFNASVGPQTAVDASEPALTAGAGATPCAPLRTLLCVEDNPANLLLVQKLVARRPDIRLLTARDAIRGIEIARTSRPDVILMDINLPGMSGITALKNLMEDAATAHIPVVALSANAMPRDIEKGLRCGFFRYLTKPIKVIEFMDTLEVALEFARTASAGAPSAERTS